jgi:hydroxyacylglutathione hydrolase
LINDAQSFTLDYIMVERVIVGPWKTNCYIYSSTKKECIIIDPGGDEGEIASRVDVLNMVPVGIALTHGHVDHVAALGRLCEGYANRGYKLPIAINPADRKFLGSGGLESHRESLELAGLDGLSFFPEDSVELPKADVRLKDGDHLFGMELVVLETPGHTPGSCCFYAEKEGILFSGDTLFFDGIGRTDLPGGSEKKLKESIQRKIAVLPPETRVFAGHGPFTTIERERRGNAFFREQPAETRPVPPKQPQPAREPERPQAKAGVKTAVKPKVAARAKVVTRKPASAKKKVPARAARTARGVASRAAASRKVPARPARPASRPAARRAPRPAAKPAHRPVKKGASVRPALRTAAAKGKVRGKGKIAPRSAGMKKRPQAARSTKAPGAGRKPAR